MKKPPPQQISDPEELDSRLVVVSSKGWIALVVTCLLIMGGILWAFFGRIPNTYETKAIYLNRQGFEEIKSPSEGTLMEVFVKTGDQTTQGQILATLENKAKETIPIKALQPGKIVVTFAEQGKPVNGGDQLFLIQKEKGDYAFYAFVPIERGQRIKKGSKAYIKIEGSDASLKSTGYQVRSVAPYAASDTELKELLGSQTLIAHFTNNQPVVIVDIVAIESAKEIEPFTIATALIVLESRRPISYLLPIWKNL